MSESARNSWLTIRVELVHGAGQDYDPPPGRDLLVGPHDTFGDLAIAIDTAFARWDLSHLHEFRLPSDRRICLPDAEWDDFEDEQAVTVAGTLTKGDEFVYVFDFGDDWTHRCRVLDDNVDPIDLFGREPEGPVPIFGLGLFTRPVRPRWT